YDTFLIMDLYPPHNKSRTIYVVIRMCHTLVTGPDFLCILKVENEIAAFSSYRNKNSHTTVNGSFSMIIRERCRFYNRPGSHWPHEPPLALLLPLSPGSLSNSRSEEHTSEL